ncbi:hypothetical protein [Streptomyces corynorhini]|uniref:DUF4355 domain-containing protein n=1 Tax=Streptomyces corynorhini TaxID=2282652 RepID=A0A370BE13_9ACTN|nr:hypothetical protein [Streptomyces corynorhini]RDG37956.1 hypothetical protein DVH02_11575 [Streptomyces corynorhini]
MPADPGPVPPVPAVPPAAQPAAPEPTDWKAEARKWEVRAKENSTAAARLAELEDANKTEAQRLAERAAAAEQSATAAQAEALRWRIAARAGISDQDAEIFLTGTSEEALTRQAERLVALRTPAPAAQDTTPQPQSHAPVEALRPGALPNPPEPTLPEQITAAEQAGDWTKARRLKSAQLLGLMNPNT